MYFYQINTDIMIFTIIILLEGNSFTFILKL